MKQSPMVKSIHVNNSKSRRLAEYGVRVSKYYMHYMIPQKEQCTTRDTGPLAKALHITLENGLG